MNKNLSIKLVILLIAVTILYSGFWFFKTAQIEKKVNSLIADNSFSSVSVSVSGFPFSQNIIIEDFKFSLPSSFLNKYQITIKKLKAESSIFSNKTVNSSLVFLYF